MSLEQALIENTAALNSLATILSNKTASLSELKDRDLDAVAPVPPFLASVAKAAKAEKAPVEKPAPVAAKPAAPSQHGDKPLDPVTGGPVAKADPYQPVKEVTLELTRVSKDRNVTLGVLRQFGVEKAPELKVEQYAAYLKAARAKLAEYATTEELA